MRNIEKAGESVEGTDFDRIMALCGEMEMENPVLLDVMSGRVFQYKKKDGKIYGNPLSGYSLFGVPLADYPLVITDYAAVEDLVVPKSE